MFSSIVVLTVIHAPLPLRWRAPVTGILEDVTGSSDRRIITIGTEDKRVKRTRSRTTLYEVDKDATIYDGRDRVTWEYLRLYVSQHVDVKVTLDRCGQHVYSIRLLR